LNGLGPNAAIPSIGGHIKERVYDKSLYRWLFNISRDDVRWDGIVRWDGMKLDEGEMQEKMKVLNTENQNNFDLCF